MQIFNFQHFLRHQSELTHFISDNSFGNQGLHIGDNNAEIINNRRHLAKKVDLNLDRFVFMRQSHGSSIVVVGDKDKGKGAYESSTAVLDTDGLMTNARGVCLVTLVADCVPILLFDLKKKVVAAIHSGWRGTFCQIAQKTVRKMKEEFECDPEDIIAGIGPSIGPCHFEVQNDVFERFSAIFGKDNKALILNHKKKYIDLKQLNREQLLKEGVLKHNIEIMDRCTFCDKQAFFSARRGDRGRFMAGIMLK